MEFLVLDWVSGLVQERCNSVANALELRLSCTDPSKCCALNEMRLPHRHWRRWGLPIWQPWTPWVIMKLPLSAKIIETAILFQCNHFMSINPLIDICSVLQWFHAFAVHSVILNVIIQSPSFSKKSIIKQAVILYIWYVTRAQLI